MVGQNKVGLGLTTYNRPEYFAQSIASAIEANPDFLVVYNDGSTKPYDEEYKKVKDNCEIIHEVENKGVALAKNALLKRLLELGCDHIFLQEDDIIIKSPSVFKKYIEVGKKLGIHHLNFAHHGPANVDGLQYSDGVVDYYPHCVGAFSYYTRECLEEVGLMDENFHNAWEHVEHTKRIGDMGYTTPFSAFADVSNSKDLLEEIPGSIEYSSIRPSKDWKERMRTGLEYWRTKDPTCPVEI